MKKYGLIGYPLSHSFSENFFANKFREEGITDCVYQNFPLENIGQLRELIAGNRDLRGLNVTIPFKEKILPYLTGSTEIVKAIGACNCVKINGESFTGYNTDVIGFEISLLKDLRPYHSKALILGEGGAAKAVAYVFEKIGIEYLYVVRKGESTQQKILFGDLSDSLINSHTIIVNSTPVGMYPNIHEYPPINYDVLGSRHYLFDLIYNPAKTMFLQKGEAGGAVIKNGQEMLILQAEESWRIWTTALDL
ncbi:MAG: shikimate dehydrogenase [Chitinophagaceae bacterium]|nr:shikimate dehydrogenase [Chitinophagaceae bacterium]